MLYVGLDGGATKTKATLLSEDFKILAESAFGGANYTAIGIAEALKNVESAILEVTKSVNNQQIKACLALAGVDSQKSMTIWQHAIKNSSKLNKLLVDPLIVNDTRAAIRSATQSKNAVVIIAGTGSNCWGTNEQGQEAKSGGGAHILGDQGSAYDIGLKILKAIHKDLDSRGPETKLTKLFFDKYKIKSREELIDLVYQKNWLKPEIAQVAQLIEPGANQNDKVATKILSESVIEITQMIEAVVSKLGLQHTEYALVKVGSVFKIKKLFSEKVEEGIRNFSPKVSFPTQLFDSATAAAHLAAES